MHYVEVQGRHGSCSTDAVQLTSFNWFQYYDLKIQCIVNHFIMLCLRAHFVVLLCVYMISRLYASLQQQQKHTQTWNNNSKRETWSRFLTQECKSNVLISMSKVITVFGLLHALWFVSNYIICIVSHAQWETERCLNKEIHCLEQHVQGKVCH